MIYNLISNIVEITANLFYEYLLIYLLLGAGIYFSIALRFIQFTNFRHTIKLLFYGINSPRGHVSSFQAFCTSLGARVGSGNIAGVAIAISLGGPGAVFWMWVVALLGMATAFCEGVLAQLYKEKTKDGNFIGGPAYYIKRGLKSRFFAIVFAISLIIAFGFAFNAVQANTMVLAVHNAFGFNKISLGIIISFITAITIIGGISRVSKVSGIAVPIMAIGYILIGLFIIIKNLDKVPDIFLQIFYGAFGIESLSSGIFGYAIILAIENGVKRGLFSNEAGMGSAANAAATAAPIPKHPVSQGYLQMLGVFVDTIIICTISALIILLSGVFSSNNEISGIELMQASLVNEIGQIGRYFIAVILVFFAFTSIISNYSYAESNIYYLTKNNSIIINIFRIMVVFMVMLGSITELKLIWNIADIAMGLMALINLMAILLLSKEIFLIIKEYNLRLSKNKAKGFQSEKYRAWRDK